ncbi:MAG: pentapeptide repeat-containing protein [Sulfuricaulis sp.]
MENSEIQKLGLERKPVTVIADQFLTRSVDHANFQHCLFHDTGAKKLLFKNGDFSYCVFERAYFHACTFIDCKFIGARFVDCNFRSASIEGCHFEYAIFKSTLISEKELLKNLPAWPKVRRELLRNLRINAESIGDAEAVKGYVREELAALREDLKKARDGKETYYAQKYNTLGKKLSVYWQSVWVWFDWHLWGHGEYPSRLLRTIIIGVTGAALYRVGTYHQFPVTTSPSSILSISAADYMDVVKAFVGVVPVSFPEGLAALLSIFRYVVLGLFISVLFRRLARR